MGTVALMMKISIRLGVLSIPTCFDALGTVPGTICLLIVGAITAWSSYEVDVFKLNHPEVYGIDDAGKLMFGSIGRNIFGAAFCLCVSLSLFIRENGKVGKTKRIFRLRLRRQIWPVSTQSRPIVHARPY